MNESLPPHSPVREGQIIAKKYRVERVLGVGGMGAVVRATHVELDQPVAVKFMLPEALASAEAVNRFLREAKIVARLKSEHIARVSDLGTLETGQPFIVMELLEGSDLRARIDNGPRIGPNEAAAYVLQACEGLAEAHRSGIVHRDLKPANLFLTRRPNGRPLVKVLDFGISKGVAMGDASLAATKTNALLGSPYYMSPEQMTSPKDVDHRTDVWSLGVILYELVTGRMPFDADTLGALFLAVYQMAPTPLPQVRPDLPPEFIAVVMRCLEKNPANRYASVEELSLALMPFAPDERLSVVPGGTAPPPVPLRELTPAPPAPPPVSAREQVNDGVAEPAPASSFGKVTVVTFAGFFAVGVVLLLLYFRFAASP
jgi:serine/threonine-protein kinase